MWKLTLGYTVSHYCYLPIIVKSGHTISLYTPCLCEESLSNLTQETSYGLPDRVTFRVLTLFKQQQQQNVHHMNGWLN
jgi:hypothetical protein